MRYLSRDLNRIVLEFAPAFIACGVVPEFDPSTPADALRQLVTGDGLKVWAGASAGTIYGDARVNHAFRAWHDRCHLASGAAFTLEAEHVVCEYQVRELLTRYPGALDVARLIRAEIIGQAEHYAAHGAFPVDQFAFFNSYAGA